MPSQALQNVQKLNNLGTTAIEVYFVKGIRVGGNNNTILGITSSGDDSRTIFISDDTSLDKLGEVLSHEICHALKINHAQEEFASTGLNLADAAVNNPFPLALMEQVYWQYNLMYTLEDGLGTRKATYLTDEQCKRIYDNASDHNAFVPQTIED